MLVDLEKREVTFHGVPTNPEDSGDDWVISGLAILIHLSGMDEKNLAQLDPSGNLLRSLKIGPEFDDTRGDRYSSPRRNNSAASRYKTSIALDDARLASAPVGDVTIHADSVAELQRLVLEDGHVLDKVFLDREADSMRQLLSVVMATATESLTPTPTPTVS